MKKSDVLGLSPAQAERIARLYRAPANCALHRGAIFGSKFVLAQPHVNEYKQIELVILVICESCSKRIEQTMNLCSIIQDQSVNGASA